MTITISDKVGNARAKQREALHADAKAIATALDKVPANSGEKLAGYLLAFGSLTKGDTRPATNPVARYLNAVVPSWSFKQPRKVEVTSHEVKVESDDYTATLPTPDGVRYFLEQFAYGAHQELRENGNVVRFTAS